jgi:ComEC/Rec2-related protein
MPRFSSFLFRRPIVLIAIAWILFLLGIDAILKRRVELRSADWQGPIEVVGVVVSDVEVVGEQKDSTACWAFLFRADRLRQKGGEWEEWDGLLRVRWYAGQYHQPPSYGDSWDLTGKVRSFANPGLRRDGHFFYGGRQNSRFLSGGHGWGILSFCYSARKKASRYLSMGIGGHEQVTDVLNAVVLGYRSGLNGEARRLFMQTGTLHIFAISGLHVGIIVCLLTSVLRYLRVSRVHWILWLGPLLILYTLATGARPSAVRACVMAILFYAAPLLGRKSDSLCSVAAACLIIIVVAPWQLFEVGFIYSFVVVTGLIVLCPIIESRLVGLWQADPMRIQPEAPWVQLSRRAGRYACSLMSLSISAWLVSAPLTLYFFGRLSPIALLSNIVVIPAAFLIVMLGCLALLGGACAGFLAAVLNFFNMMFVTLLFWVMELISRVPFGANSCPAPPLLAILAWYVVLVGVAVGQGGQGDRCQGKPRDVRSLKKEGEREFIATKSHEESQKKGGEETPEI